MVVLAVDKVVGFDLGIAPMVFSMASLDGKQLYDVRVCGVDEQPVRVTSGYSVKFDHGPEVLTEADTVIVPGTHARGPRHHGTLPPALAAALRLIPPAARIMSICTGAFVLGAAGILDGRKATTHWAWAESFRRLYPKVDLDETVLFVDNGDVLTSAGLAAGADLCLHVVRSDHGSDVANRAARYCVLPPWRDGGQSQFIDRPVPEMDGGSTAATREWALLRLSEPLHLATLAEHASMSVRTFSRRFRAETGLSARVWLNRQRLLRARHLLESTTLPVDRVAAESGLGTAASLRQHMQAVIGVSPLAYRRTFSRP